VKEHCPSANDFVQRTIPLLQEERCVGLAGEYVCVSRRANAVCGSDHAELEKASLLALLEQQQSENRRLYQVCSP
jgi:hypothetical protein